MTSAAVFRFDETAKPATALATTLGIACHPILVHHFPDRESLVRVPPSPPTALLYRSLDDPNAKLIELLLAASALRESGARRVRLVAPYLAYMRQDRAFNPGEAVSQRVIGQLLAEHFDGLLTIDPHLHRTTLLSEIVPGIETVTISAAPVLAAALDPAEQPILVGPDRESGQWVDAIAASLGLESLVGAKQRKRDDQVSIHVAGDERCKGRTVVVVDDVISTGETLIALARQLQRAGAMRIEALATHCLADALTLVRLDEEGLVRVRTTESVPGPAALLPISPLIANAIQQRGWIED